MLLKKQLHCVQYCGPSKKKRKNAKKSCRQPIVSSEVNSSCQVDLIDKQLKADEPYK